MVAPKILRGEVPLMASTYSQMLLQVHIQKERERERKKERGRGREKERERESSNVLKC